MGFEVYTYIRIHTNNEEELESFLKHDSSYLWSFRNSTHFYRYKKSYISIHVYNPLMISECRYLVNKFHSFLIFADWHEEANPEHGYFMIRWNDDKEEIKEINFNYTTVEERGEFNRYAKQMRKMPIDITYDKNLKEFLLKHFSLPFNHIGIYSQIWLDTYDDIQEILKSFPEECIRTHWSTNEKAQMILWTPEPLYPQFASRLSSIVCEWWSDDGVKGGVWVKQDLLNETFTFDYPCPYTPSYGEKLTEINVEEFLCPICLRNDCENPSCKKKKTYLERTSWARGS